MYIVKYHKIPNLYTYLLHNYKKIKNPDSVLEANFLRDICKLKKTSKTDLHNNFEISRSDSPKTKNTLYIEPPCIFVGRGLHPLRGRIKFPVDHSQVQVNVDYVANANDFVHHVQGKSWIVAFICPLTHKTKYIFPPNKSENDQKKYSIAQKIKKKLPQVRQVVSRDMNSCNKKLKQLATLVHIIDRTCIRVGTDERANTTGCCTLKVNNVHLYSNNRVHLDFLGKDSIRYNKIHFIEAKAHQNLGEMLSKKKKKEYVFDLIDSGDVNKYLQSIVPHLTAKMFRTINASCTMYKGLKNATNIQDYKNVNEKVAKLCNHSCGDKVSMNTSKTNYIDPRIVYSWAKKHNISVNSLYSKSQLQRHSWASDTPNEFSY